MKHRHAQLAVGATLLRKQQGVLGHIRGGQVSPLVTFESGIPFNVTNGQDTDGLDGSGDRADFNHNDRPLVRRSQHPPRHRLRQLRRRQCPVNSTTAQYIRLPPHDGWALLLRTGNLGRNSLPSPSINNFDVNFLKPVALIDKAGIELRAKFS